MKVLIVDDEPLARARLRALINELGGYVIVGEAGNGKQGIDLAKICAPDVVLMDIGMPGVNGMEAAGRIKQFDVPPSVIFITAYGEYALEAFEQQAVDYLLKPVRKERLHQALQRARALRQPMSPTALLATVRSHISVILHGDLRLVPVKDVFFFRAEQKYVTLRWRGGEAVTDEPLIKLEEEFAGQFLRIHRNALVGLAHISGVFKFGKAQHVVAFRDVTDRLEISRRHLPLVKKTVKDMRGIVEE